MFEKINDFNIFYLFSVDVRCFNWMTEMESKRVDAKNAVDMVLGTMKDDSIECMK